MEDAEFILIIGRMRQALYALTKGDVYDKSLAIEDLKRWLDRYEVSREPDELEMDK